MRRTFLKLIRRRNLQADLEAELAFHNEMSVANSNPIRLGNAAVIQESAFDAWRFNAIENLWRDLVYAFRSLRRSPAFVLSALLSLALGIGLNTALFSVAVEFLLSEPSVVDARSWVSIQLGGSSRAKPETVQFLRDSGVFQDVVGEDFLDPINWNNGSETRSIFSVQTTRNYFSALGIPLAQGRTFTESDPRNVAVLRHQFWQNRFNSDPGIVGRSINLDGRAYTVLGVLPASHRTLVGFGVSPDIYLPRILPDTQLVIYARVRPGMSLGQCRMAVHFLAKRLDQVMPQPDMKYADDTRVTPLAGFARIQQGKGAVLVGVFFAVVLALAGLVLLIACVNVASLMLVRATVRKQEIAVRLSLGASRARLLQQLLAESLLLSLAGTGAGFVLAQLAAKALAAIQLPIPIPLHLQIEPDWRVVAYAALLGAVATIACGLLPAFHSIRESFTESLHRERRQRLRRVLVTAQVAVSVIVLATGSLFLRNLFLAGATNPGFDVRATLRAEIHLPPGQYRDSRAQRAYIDMSLAQLAAIPGIVAAGAARIIPFTDESNHRAVLTFLETGRKRDASFHTNGVSADFFRAMNIPLLAGRTFNPSDRDGAHAVIVNQKFVELYLDGHPPVGTTFQWGDPRSIYQIVGVVAGTKNATIGEAPSGQLYEALSQIENDRPQIQFVIRSRTPPSGQIASVRKTLRQVEPASGVDVSTMASSIGLAFLPSQVGALLMGSIGCLGLLLAATGLYGVTSYSVARRTREIGIRVAIGATRPDIVRIVLNESARLLLTGSTIGLFIAFFVTRPLATFFVEGLHAGDPLSFASVVLVLAATGVVATLGPVRRAIRVEPVTALRYE